jgi:DNA mismatch repair protein MutS2
MWPWLLSLRWDEVMNDKHWRTLELEKILQKLAGYTQFSGGGKLARELMPCGEIHQAQEQLALTSEARRLLDARPDTSIGGARDVREKVAVAQRGAVLLPPDLLDIRGTLVSGRALQRILTRLEKQFPLLADVARRMQPAESLIDEIDRCIDDRAQVRDSASRELARARRDVRIAHDRLHERLQRLLSSRNVAPYLQEAIITQRGGRYVLPLQANFKGRVRGIIHDQSASGATIFVEPLSIVELNNKWREAQLAEEKEVQKVLATLSDLVASEANTIQWTVEALAELDLAFAKARYAEAIDATVPELLPFPLKTRSPVSGSDRPYGVVRLKQARHPLLDPATVVPIDVELDDETAIVVITGPNTGGKTVSLKTVGLLTLMSQCGLHIPVAQGSALTCFEQVYADIGDEQSIEQNLSTFSAHLTNILSFLEDVDDRSLVLLDELGAGTDPDEGAALARAILDHMGDRGATTFVATHYPELKIYAHTTPGVANANVEFDLDTLAPTFHLSIGLPGRSNAFAIAARLGMPAHIIESARGMVDETDLHTEDLLAGIAQAYQETLTARDEAEAARDQAESLLADTQARLTYIEDERREVVNMARKQARRELDQVRAEIARMRDKLAAAAVTLEALEGVEEESEALMEQVAPQVAPPPPRARSRRGQGQAIRPGDNVWVEALNTSGRVTALDGEEAEVRAGRVRLRIKANELVWQAPQAEPEADDHPQSVLSSGIPQSPGVEIDLRGQTTEDALPRVDKHLDAAALAGLPWVRIIHGHGTGVLKRAVREMLRGHPLVKSYEPGKSQEGGEGVTIARLVSSK